MELSVRRAGLSTFQSSVIGGLPDAIVFYAGNERPKGLDNAFQHRAHRIASARRCRFGESRVERVGDETLRETWGVPLGSFGDVPPEGRSPLVEATFYAKNQKLS